MDTPGYTGDALNTLDDIDYDAAVSSMKKTETSSHLESKQKEKTS